MKAKKLTVAVMAALMLGTLTACGENTKEMSELPAETFSSAEETGTVTMIETVPETTAEETTQTAAETTTQTTMKETEKLTETSAVTSAEITTTTETTVMTTVTVENTSAATIPTAKIDTATGLYLTSDGLVLDPDNVLDEDAGWDSYEENVPYFISQPADNIRIYGVTRDASHSWTKFFDGFEKEVSDYVVIEHDGIVDEFEGCWQERFGNPIEKVYVGDYDGDGKEEISTLRYWNGGTVCIVYELCIYDLENGHYIRHEIDNEKLLSEYITYTADDEAHTLILGVNGSDLTYTLDTSSFTSDEVSEIYFGDIVTFEVNGTEMTIYASPKICGYDVCSVSMKLHYSDGTFRCTDPAFYPEWNSDWNNM